MSLLKVLHIAGGLISLLSGAVALAAAKGGSLHRRSGLLFVGSMLFMAATGTTLAALKSERPSVVGGVITLYMVTTALLTVRRPRQDVPWLDTAAMLVGAAIGIFSIGIGIEAARSVSGQVDGVPAGPNFLFGGVVLLAAFGDLRTLRTGPARGARRLVRHLWRMCYAMFTATGSFFLGQAKVFPETVRASGILPVPVLLVLAAMLFWLLRLGLASRSHSADRLRLSRNFPRLSK